LIGVITSVALFSLCTKVYPSFLETTSLS